jgi:hypothetical protein
LEIIMAFEFIPVSLNELRRYIPLFADKQTPIIQSEPGVGKTSLLYTLEEDMGTDEWDYIYVDCPSKDYGDIGMNIPVHDTKSLEFYAASLFKLDSPKKKVILLDEFLKTGKGLRVIFTRLILERMVGDRALPEGSLVFATSNNAADGVGDFAQAHEGNRVVFLDLAKPTAAEWVAWAIRNGASDIVCSFAMMNESVFASYLDEKERSNPFIFNPKTNCRSFVSPRSLFKADAAFVQSRDKLDAGFLRAALIGTLGKSGGELLASYVSMASEVVDPKQVFSDPDNVQIPSKLAVLYMLMFNAARAISIQDELSAFLKFLDRTKSNELTQGVFYTMLANDRSKTKLAYQNARIQKWMQANPHLVF